MSAKVRIVAEVDGNEVEVNVGNPLRTMSSGLGRRQVAALLEVAVGQIARAYRLDCEVRISAPALTPEGGEER